MFTIILICQGLIKRGGVGIKVVVEKCGGGVIILYSRVMGHAFTHGVEDCKVL